MAIKKKSLIDAATDKKKAANDGKSVANPAPAKSKKLGVAKIVTAKLSTAKLAMLRKLH
jgi:hypothetical protein